MYIISTNIIELLELTSYHGAEHHGYTYEVFILENMSYVMFDGYSPPTEMEEYGWYYKTQQASMFYQNTNMPWGIIWDVQQCLLLLLVQALSCFEN